MPPETLPRVLDSRTVYRGRIVEAAVERLQMPGRDQPVTVEVVRHAPSVGIAAMPSPDSVWLVRQYRHAVPGWLWELPAGSVDEGERPEDAARRECHEELGLVAGDAQRIGELIPLPGYCSEVMTFFRLTALRTPGPGDPAAHQDEDEDIEARVFTFAEVREMVGSGEIRDMKVVAALALIES